MNSNETPVTPAKAAGKRKKRNIASGYADLLQQGLITNATWQKNKAILLRYITQAEFETLITTFELVTRTRSEVGGTRKALTDAMKRLDDIIENAIVTLKSYLKSKYTNDQAARPHYLKFGIIAINGSYKLPTDRSKRLAALELIVKAVSDEGFGNMEFGTAWWTNTLVSYKQQFNQGNVMDSDVSMKTDNQHKMAATIRQVITSHALIVRANNPTGYKAELTTLGIQKVKF